MILAGKYEIFDTKTGEIRARISIETDHGSITGAEQDLVILGPDIKAVAIVQLQPGYDRRQL